MEVAPLDRAEEERRRGEDQHGDDGEIETAAAHPVAQSCTEGDGGEYGETGGE